MSEQNPCPFCVEDIVNGAREKGFVCGSCGYVFQETDVPFHKLLAPHLRAAFAGKLGK